ncbi:MAG: SAM-dependent methyltransferase [Clostridia bacterium]|nr:SAM-dependent methyltransferase [Clostridia bacterium]
MGKIKLDSRLSAVADFVREGKTVADIGTDHAYLLAYLLQQGTIENGIAADLRKGPLENARKTLIESDQLEKVNLILSDGLDELKKGDCEDIVIAGMGGILIKEILERTPWVFDENIHIIAQPMTHAEVLRRFFLENGFKILEESSATDGKRFYCIISAQYDGIKRDAEEWYTYVGELIKNRDNVSQTYIEKTIATLEKKLVAMQNAGVGEVDTLTATVATLKQKVENNG